MTENFRPKVTAIRESICVDFILVDELIGSLQSYEIDLPKTNKSKSMALKFVDDCRFDDELSSIETAYLAKNFRNFLRNNNRRARNRNNVDSKNMKKNDTAKNNNSEKSKEKVSQSSNSSFATSIVSEIETVDENHFDGELSENADLQEVYNKLCKIAGNDAMSVKLELKKINTLEQEKKKLPLKLFNANELLNSVKIENMTLLEKVKSLELDLSIAREKIDRSSASKLDDMLNVQKYVSNKTGLGFVKSRPSSIANPPKFVPAISSSIIHPSVSKVKVHKEEVLASRRTKVDLSKSKPKNPNQSGSKKHDKPQWFCHFCGESGHTRPNCFKLQASK